MAFRQKWEGFENRIKAKREINRNGKRKQQETHKVDQLTVQRLSSDVSGKAQKFSRIGPREFVPYPYGDLTIANIKNACEAHFMSQLRMNVECDILAGEQGPSCTSLDQVPNLKLIHIRFIGTTREKRLSSCSSRASSSSSYHFYQPDSEVRSSRAKRKHEQPAFVGSSYAAPRAKSPGLDVDVKPGSKGATANTHYPESLSVTQMINLGKVVRHKTKTAELYKFNLENMTWSSIPEKIELVVEKKAFAQGAFREVYKATSSTKGYRGCPWVVKKYLPKTLQFVEELGQTVEDHTRKAVQMQSLAKNIAESMLTRVKNVCENQFGESFVYTDLYMAILEDGEYVTIEKFIDGDFTKFINNDGLVCGDKATDVCKKAECLAHYSYEKSSGKLMLLDVQGSVYNLFDPEIASATLQADEEYLFGIGNLTSQAINAFIENHQRNIFCSFIGLKQFVHPS